VGVDLPASNLKEITLAPTLSPIVRVESVPHIAELPDALQQLRDGLGNAIAEQSVPDFGAPDH